MTTDVERSEALHLEKHEMEQESVKTALAAEKQRDEDHRTAHSAAHHAHEVLHEVYEQSHQERHKAEQRALEAAVVAMDKRLDSMNEFRDQLRDQAATFVRREQLEEFITRYERAHDEVLGLVQTEREERRANEGSRRGTSSSIAWIIAAISAVGGVLGIIIVISNVLTTR
jgi:hypothetical protein